MVVVGLALDGAFFGVTMHINGHWPQLAIVSHCFQVEQGRLEASACRIAGGCEFLVIRTENVV